MKDNFSAQAADYARYRPVYPAAYFEFLLSLTPNRDVAWDCGTGNGQVAEQLAGYFKQVKASDISAAQIAQAKPNERVTYSVQPAEGTDFPNAAFDVIVVAQAIHWFNFEKFYAEVNRVLKPGGILSVVGYAGLQVTPEVDVCKKEFYTDIVGPYWDKERKYVDENYQTIPFPFAEIPSPELYITAEWNVEHLIGYLTTWSATRHFIKEKGFDPVAAFAPKLRAAWGDTEWRTIRFPVMMRMGRKRG